MRAVIRHPDVTLSRRGGRERLWVARRLHRRRARSEGKPVPAGRQDEQDPAGPLDHVDVDDVRGWCGLLEVEPDPARVVLDADERRHDPGTLTFLAAVEPEGILAGVARR